MATKRRLQRGQEHWTDNPENLPKVVVGLERQSATRMVLSRCLLRQYWNRPIVPRSFADMDSVDLQRFAFALEQIMTQLGWNVTRQIVDAAAARICKQLTCKVLTTGGDAALQQQATKMTRLIDGINDDLGTLETAERVFVDACTAEVGAMLPYWDEDAAEIRHRRVDPLGIFWHHEEGEDPAHLYTIEPISREMLCDLYPRKADAIADAPTWKRPIVVGVEGTSADATLETVKVTCGWKRTRGSAKGKYVMAVGNNIVLESDDYPHRHHQLVLYRWSPDFRGAGGVALGRLLSPYHRWMNQITQICYGSLRGAVPHMLRHESTEITNLSDMPFQDLTWTGTVEPKLETPNPVSEQILQFMQTIPNQAGIETGINAAVAAGQKPVGINGQAALREYIDFADSRLARPFGAWKRFFADVARVDIALCAEHYRNDPILVRAPGADFLEEIRWKDVDLTKQKYRLRFEVTSGLAGSVSGKMQQMDDLKSLGLGDAIDYARTLKDDLPDIAAFADRVTAPRDLAIRMVDQALEGTYLPPSPLMGPDGLNAIQLIGTQRYNKALLDNRNTPEQMEVLRKLIRAAQRKTAPPLPQLQPVAPAPALSPGAIQQVGQPGPVAQPQ